MLKYFLFLLPAVLFVSLSFGQTDIPLGGNAYITDGEGAAIKRNGLTNWSDAKTVVTVWFKTSSSGNLKLSIKAKSDSESKIKVMVEGKTFAVHLSGKDPAIDRKSVV